MRCASIQTLHFCLENIERHGPVLENLGMKFTNVEARCPAPVCARARSARILSSPILQASASPGSAA